MTTTRWTLGFVLCLSAIVVSASRAEPVFQATTTAIVGATIIDGNGGAPIADGVDRHQRRAHHGDRAAERRDDSRRRDRDRRTRPLDHSRHDRHQRPPLALRRPERSLRDDGAVSAARRTTSSSRPRRSISATASRPCATATARCVPLVHGARRDRARRQDRRAHPRRRQHPRLERAVLVLVQPRHGPADAVPGADERLHRAGRRRRADGDDAGRAARGHRRLHRQGAGLPQVRRHQPLLRADVHRLLARGAEVIVEEAPPARRKSSRRTRRASKGCACRSRPASTASSTRSCSTAARCRTISSRRSSRRGLVCSMLVSTITGPAWERHVKAKDGGREEERGGREGRARACRTRRRPRSGARRRPTLGADLEMRAQERAEADSRRRAR